MPTAPKEWIAEIAAAYLDAAEAIPFGPMVGKAFGEAELFHLAPEVAVKFRGLGRSKRTLEKAAEAALASYAENRGRNGGVLRQRHLAFAFCYLVSHYGLKLLTARQVNNLVIYVEANRPALTDLVRAMKPVKRSHPIPRRDTDGRDVN
jgi:hypothetical protein